LTLGGVGRDTQKTESLESLEAKFACQKCPCDWPRRCSQINQFVNRFEAPQQRTACPVAKKAISENRESDQSVARLGNANFGLGGRIFGFQAALARPWCARILPIRTSAGIVRASRKVEALVHRGFHSGAAKTPLATCTPWGGGTRRRHLYARRLRSFLQPARFPMRWKRAPAASRGGGSRSSRGPSGDAEGSSAPPPNLICARNWTRPNAGCCRFFTCCAVASRLLRPIPVKHDPEHDH
jgi:hypothetical protein